MYYILQLRDDVDINCMSVLGLDQTDRNLSIIGVQFDSFIGKCNETITETYLKVQDLMLYVMV